MRLLYMLMLMLLFNLLFWLFK